MPPTASSTSPTGRTAGSSTSTPRPATRPRRRDARRRRRPSPSATIPSPWPWPAVPATSTWPTPGAGEGSPCVSLSTHAVVNTISTSQPSNGTGVVQSIGMSPDNNEVLAVLNGLSFPGDVMATINTSTESITSTVNLETGTDAMGQLVSDGTSRLRLGHGQDQRRRRRSEPESRRLGPGQPALRHGGRRHLARSRAPAGPPPTEAGLERRAATTRRAPAVVASRRRSPCRRTSRRSAR